jgi:hypothetical protein
LITYKGKCPSLLAHLLWFSQVEAATNWYNALNEGRRKKEEGRRKKEEGKSLYIVNPDPNSERKTHIWCANSKDKSHLL